jgi:hypothetical protein
MRCLPSDTPGTIVRMTDYQVVCVTLLEPARHRHVLGIGTVAGSAARRWTVDEVWLALHEGDRFYTNDGHGRRAFLERWECRTCGLRTVRTAPGSVSDSNLDCWPRCGARHGVSRRTAATWVTRQGRIVFARGRSPTGRRPTV